MASSDGFEPPTSGFVNRRSLQAELRGPFARTPLRFGTRHAQRAPRQAIRLAPKIAIAAPERTARTLAPPGHSIGRASVRGPAPAALRRAIDGMSGPENEKPREAFASRGLSHSGDLRSTQASVVAETYAIRIRTRGSAQSRRVSRPLNWWLSFSTSVSRMNIPRHCDAVRARTIRRRANASSCVPEFPTNGCSLFHAGTFAPS